MLRRRNTESGLVWPLDHAAVGADVWNAGVGVFGDAIRRGEQKTAIETGGADRHWESEQPPFGMRHLPSLENDLFNRSRFHEARRDRMAQGSIPALRHFARRAIFFQAKGHLVDLTRSAEHSNRNLAVVALPFRIGHVIKEECLSLVVRQTLILPPDQRHKFAIFLDPGADAVKISGFLQKRNEIPEIAEVGSSLGFERRLCHVFLVSLDQ